MKKNLIAMTVLVSSVVGATAYAADGQINFTGEITDTACEVTNSVGSPLEVTLGKISKTAFSSVGSKASTTQFSLELKNCPDTVTSVKIKFDGATVNGDNSVLALSPDVDVAEGVGIQLSDASNNMLPLFSASQAYPLTKGAVNNLGFTASYIAIADIAEIKPGKANATANFTINYN